MVILFSSIEEFFAFFARDLIRSLAFAAWGVVLQ
jgi:hypothetical protein